MRKILTIYFDSLPTTSSLNVMRHVRSYRDASSGLDHDENQ
uniref:Uncharacterized protein n=1 Tax=Nelumbo nucifera TaxID=4432 RepID=A0A822Z9P7_NELNU|nr:TPA_asm: hypothetical protein HUJ06_014089 [Nelumbo nucifera]